MGYTSQCWLKLRTGSIEEGIITLIYLFSPTSVHGLPFFFCFFCFAILLKPTVSLIFCLFHFSWTLFYEYSPSVFYIFIFTFFVSLIAECWYTTAQNHFIITTFILWTQIRFCSRYIPIWHFILFTLNTCLFYIICA